ncbi:MAG TPA: hypothetical protein VEX64_00625 [Pyrinomonadaceae bacterium]|nr:hypothetical protein [Pyrinomonadaceae bacterium]
MPLAFHFSQKVATRLHSIIAVLRNKQKKTGLPYEGKPVFITLMPEHFF